MENGDPFRHLKEELALLKERLSSLEKHQGPFNTVVEQNFNNIIGAFDHIQDYLELVGTRIGQEYQRFRPYPNEDDDEPEAEVDADNVYALGASRHWCTVCGEFHPRQSFDRRKTHSSVCIDRKAEYYEIHGGAETEKWVKYLYRKQRFQMQQGNIYPTVSTSELETWGLAPTLRRAE